MYFAKVRKESYARRTKMLDERQQKRTQDSSHQFEIGSLTKQLADDCIEAEALENRKGNLPESFIAVRDAMCRDLRIAPSDLPFAAEIISVIPNEREWESSVEQVLHSFARSLLVSSEFYVRVAGYVDRTQGASGCSGNSSFLISVSFPWVDWDGTLLCVPGFALEPTRK